ncbi:MAG: aminoacyl-tRNA hydrolase [Ilumatobacteraceae bacterium]
MIDAIIVGLGNPGRQYAGTRHNVGEEAVALLAERHGTALKAGRDKALVAEAEIAGKRVVLAFPTTYMNDSGIAVGALMRRHRVVDPKRLIIVHDELDLPVGGLKVKDGGGLAGNNGLRSITQHMHTQDYLRVRIGIGKPTSKERGVDHVLSRVPKAERKILDVVVERAADAVEAILANGALAAMTAFNGL